MRHSVEFLGYCFCEYTFSHFSTTLACDGQTDRQTDRQRATIAYTTLAKHHAAKNSSTDPNLGKITNWYQTFFTDSERMRLHGVWGKRSCCQPLTTCVVTILIIYHASSL